MVKRLLLLSVLLVAIVPVTGCWDRIELEQRGFVTGVAIDEAQGTQNSEHNQNVYRVTFQEVIPAGLKQTGQTGGSHAGDAYFNISLEGRSMLSIIAKMSGMTSRTPFFEHLKLVVISEEVARSENGFANVLDYFLRNNDARRNVAIMVAKGEAKQVLETMPQGEKTPVMFVQSISKNQESYRMVPETRIGEIHENLLKHESYVVQKVNVKDKFISLIGAAVMDGTKNNLVGFLDETETEGYNFLRQGIQGGVLEINVNDNLVVFKVERAERTIKVDESNPNRLKFKIRLRVEGSLLEAFEQKDYLQESTLDTIQAIVTKTVDSIVSDTINKSQKVLKRDVIGLGTYLKERYPKLWKEVGPEWDTGRSYFLSSEIDIESNVRLRRIGSVNNTEND